MKSASKMHEPRGDTWARRGDQPPLQSPAGAPRAPVDSDRTAWGGQERLAQAVGAQLQTFYRDGACFIPLAVVSNPALAAFALASALKLPDSSAKPPQSRLIEHLRRKEMLLVLDNFEQLIGGSAAAVELVAELLGECPVSASS